jgi:hypothetical protein
VLINRPQDCLDAVQQKRLIDRNSKEPQDHNKDG